MKVDPNDERYEDQESSFYFGKDWELKFFLMNMLIRIEYLMGESIDGKPVSNSNSSDGSDSVLGVSSLGLIVVISSISSAVGLIPGVVGDGGVPFVVDG